MCQVNVTVAMFVMTKNASMRTLMKVTMSMKTTLNTGRHRVLRIVWSCFPFCAVQIICIRGVVRSLRCGCLLLGKVVRPCIDLCSKPVLWKKRRNSFFICYSVIAFHVGLCVSLLVHAHLVLLVLEVAIHDCSVTVSLCGIQVISYSLQFLRFCRISITSTL